VARGSRAARPPPFSFGPYAGPWLRRGPTGWARTGPVRYSAVMDPATPPGADSAEPRSVGSSEVKRFAPLIERLSPRLLAWVRLRLGGRGGRLDAEDVVQEVWCRALQKLGGDRATEDKLSEGWVFQIAKFVLLESLRKAQLLDRVQFAEGRSSRVQAIQQFPAELTTMTRRLAREEGMRAFLDRIEALDPVDKKIYLLCGLEALEHQDVAVQLGMERGAVTKRWQRLRQKLSQMRPPPGLLRVEDDA